MFADKFDALMNIAEVSNSQLGRNVHINPSYIGRLRSGARPLPKKHDYLPAVCRYLAERIKKEYQLTALHKLTGMDSAAPASFGNLAEYLERWLSEQGEDTSAATGRLISGISRTALRQMPLPAEGTEGENTQKFAPCLYGNAGKRKAVEQFFTAVLQAEKPQTLLLFSDENMAWLYEDAAFAARWASLFAEAIRKGNRVKIIHNISRDMNEMLEAVTKWLPIYMTGMIEPYYYPRLRDGVFQRTLFLAPDTAAVLSASVQQNTDGMLNLFLTDKSALEALHAEFEHYFALCRPLMRIHTAKDAEQYGEAAQSLAETEENACLCAAIPPLFTMPEELVRELTVQSGNKTLYAKWEQGLAVFSESIKSRQFTLVLLSPESALLSPEKLSFSTGELTPGGNINYTKQQYLAHIGYVKKLEAQCKNLTIRFVNDLADNILLFIKENTGVILTKTDAPGTAFIINERNMVSAFWDYMEKHTLL